jgi:hypothetical protein
MISFSGKKRSGKDLSAQYLIDNFGYKKFSLADAVKQFTSKILGIPLAQLMDDELKDKPFNVSIQLYSSEIVLIVEDLIELNNSKIDEIKWDTIPREKNLKTPREALQFVGTDLGRNVVSQNIWLNQVPAQFDGNIVVTDARFANERALFKSKGFKTVLLMRNSDSTDTHESENSLGHPKEYDEVIRNFGSKDKLYTNLNAIVNPTLGNRIKRMIYG